MSRFYLTMDGGRSNSEVVTRRGHGGAYVTAASYHGAIRVSPYRGPNDEDMVRIERTSWQGSGGPNVVIYDGPFDINGDYATDLEVPKGAST